MKQKIDTRKTARSSRPPKSLRSLWLEALFFVALAVFGFSVVASLLGVDTKLILQFAAPAIAGGSDEANSGPGLYEAASRRLLPAPSLSPIFTPSVQYWKDQIMEWAADYSLDPNLVATVMQIESCGNPDARSRSGAMGLFQVMPFHFEADEQPYDPDTNALRGVAYLARGMEVSGGHAGLALAGYNGGHSIIARSYDDWAYETQRYYRWGSGIYRESSAGWDSSPTLAAWLAAGGQSLCDAAETALGISKIPATDGIRTRSRTGPTAWAWMQAVVKSP